MIPSSKVTRQVESSGSPGQGNRRLFRHAWYFSLATLISRLLGYARDACAAWMLGGGYTADIFYAAFRIPNLFRRLLGEGAMNASFIPIFSEYVAKKTRTERNRFFSAFFGVMVMVLTAVVLLGIFKMDLLAKIVAWGFEKEPGKLDMTIKLSRIMMPFLGLVCIAALFSAALNSVHIYFIPAVAPAMLSLCEIGFLYFAFSKGLAPLKWLALSVLAGGLLQLLIQVPSLWKQDFKLSFRPDWKHPDVKRVGILLLPAFLGISVDQLNAFVDTICASFLANGSVTALYNSNRLMSLPLALFGVSMASASLPALSRHAVSEEWTDFKDTLSSSLRLIIVTVMPAAVGLMCLALPVISLLFERGRFTHPQSILTAQSLIGYSVGLVAFSAVKILAGSFYAIKDTKTPVKIGAVCMLINVGLNLLLMRTYKLPLGIIWPGGAGGLALATSISSICNAGMLFYLLRVRIGQMHGRRLLNTFSKAAVCSLIMAVSTLFLAYVVIESIPFKVGIGIISGVGVYLASAHIIKLEESKYFWKLLRLKKETLSID